VTGGREFEPAADGRAMQGCDRRDVTSADDREDRMPGAGMVEHFGRLAGAVLGEVETGAEARAMAKNHHRTGFTLRPARCRFELGQK
jgi:hypothetical protein